MLCVMARSKPASSRSRRARAKDALPLPAYLATRRQRRRVVVAVVVAVVAALIVADRAGLLLYAGDDMARYDRQTFRVAYVVDGDTLHVDASDGDQPVTRVRLWGIASPEMAWPEYGKLDDDPFAQEATDLARELAEGAQVTLELEAHRLRGEYGRLLAHVHLADGRSLNEEMLKAGLAKAEPRWSHEHLARYAALEREARAAGRGLWARP